MSVKNGVIMREEKKNALSGLRDKATEVRRKLLRLYLQYVNPKLAKVIDAVSDPKTFIRKVLPQDISKWITIAALTTGLLVLTMPEYFWDWQIVIFMGIFLLGPTARQMLHSIRSTFYNLLVAYPGKYLLQQEIVLDKPIVNGNAEVVLHGETWQLRGDDCPAGSRVKVIAIKENILFVSLLN